LPSSSLSGVCSLILFQLFATGVNDTGGKFSASVVDTGGNLPPASLTPAANNWNNIREFSKKFEMILMLLSWAWGKVIHEKKPEAKNLVTLSL
jgi:hypothetical protein